jgi:hypothetical protein
MVIDMINQEAHLYGNAEVLYEDFKLNAGYIKIDFRSKIVKATGVKDSVGKEIQRPVFEQGAEKFTAGVITYNFDTKKGKIKDVITQQGEGYIHGRDIKKDTNNVYFVSHGKYTTCDLEQPHFYINAKKIKVIPNDKIITGPANLYIADIPTPLAIPFGYFPNKKGRASGILLPTYGETQTLGFFLRDGGFYFGGNEYIDLALRGDIYSNGSYGLKATTNYKKRYSYNGGLNLNYSSIWEGDKEFPNTTHLKNFFLGWSHFQDTKSHPSSRFSANVNAGSSSYNKYNGNPTGSYLTNTISSNIAYSKSFIGTPFNFSANARHTQNTITKTLDLSLPELALSMNRIYPFKSKNAVGNRWYDKIGISANANARNDINTYDSLLFTDQTLKKMKNGLLFNVPISTSFNVLKYFTLTPNLNFSSKIYSNSIRKYYDIDSNYVFRDTISGVKVANDFSTSVGLSTRIYGDYFFKTKYLKQIRHVVTPTISASYRPDFSESQYGYYKQVQIDPIGTKQEYSIFENGIYGSPALGKSGILGFNLNNSIEAKIRHETDSGRVDKKAVLIESFNIAFFYNMAVDHFNWSTINLNGRTKLFKVIDINAGATLDPYQIDSSGARIEKFEWQNNRIGRLVNSNLSVSTSLKSKQKKASSNIVNTDPQVEQEYLRSHPDYYVDFSIPWNLSVYYNIYYSKLGLKDQVSQTATFNGDLNVTKNWKIGITSGYDFNTNKATLTSINIYRDLHCWEMRFNWIPFGFRQSFALTINVKSSILQDLKFTRRNSATGLPVY